MISKIQKGIKVIYSSKELGQEMEIPKLFNQKNKQISLMSVTYKVSLANTLQFAKS